VIVGIVAIVVAGGDAPAALETAGQAATIAGAYMERTEGIIWQND